MFVHGRGRCSLYGSLTGTTIERRSGFVSSRGSPELAAASARSAARTSPER